jgi:uncharacterized protein
MRWTPGGRSDDVEDDRGQSGGGGFGGIHVGIGGFLLLLVLSLVFHRNFLALAGFGGGASAPIQTTQRDPALDQKEEPLVQFVSFVLDDAQKTWTQILSQEGVRYRHAKLALFRNRINSACGMAQSASGPFYCPEDEKVYIDLAFYDELKQRFGAPGEFAQAYVLAHELGHHVQKVIGVEEKVQEARQRNPQAANQLSERLELQADCFAGVWGHSTDQRKLLDPGEVQQGLNAAAAVGDDRLQRMAGRAVNPETFTHGSSQQRMDWFQKGFGSGDMKECNTFGQ